MTKEEVLQNWTVEAPWEKILRVERDKKREEVTEAYKEYERQYLKDNWPNRQISWPNY